MRIPSTVAVLAIAATLLPLLPAASQFAGTGVSGWL